MYKGNAPSRSIYQDPWGRFLLSPFQSSVASRWLLCLYQHPSRLQGRREFPSLHPATSNVHSASRPTSMEMMMIPPHETDTRVTAELCELDCIKRLWLYQNVSLIFYTLPQWVSDGFTAIRFKLILTQNSDAPHLLMLELLSWSARHVYISKIGHSHRKYTKSVTVIENTQNDQIISSTFEYQSLSA